MRGRESKIKSISWWRSLKKARRRRKSRHSRRSCGNDQSSRNCAKRRAKVWRDGMPLGNRRKRRNRDAPCLAQSAMSFQASQFPRTTQMARVTMSLRRDHDRPLTRGSFSPRKHFLSEATEARAARRTSGKSLGEFRRILRSVHLSQSTPPQDLVRSPCPGVPLLIGAARPGLW